MSTASDHAVLRYMERVHGIDVERYRAELLTLAAPYLETRAQSGAIGELWCVIKNDTIVTLTPRKPAFHWRHDREEVNKTLQRFPPRDWREKKRKRAHK
jgi:hypothetical protein